jgi:hypothetical protein
MLHRNRIDWQFQGSLLFATSWIATDGVVNWVTRVVSQDPLGHHCPSPAAVHRLGHGLGERKYHSFANIQSKGT